MLQFDGFVEFQELVLSKKASEITQHNNHPARTCKHPHHQNLGRYEKRLIILGQTHRSNTSSTRTLIDGPVSISYFLRHSNMRGHIIEEDDHRNQPRKYLSVQDLIIEPF